SALRVGAVAVGIGPVGVAVAVGRVGVVLVTVHDREALSCIARRSGQDLVVRQGGALLLHLRKPPFGRWTGSYRASHGRSVRKVRGGPSRGRDVRRRRSWVLARGLGGAGRHAIDALAGGCGRPRDRDSRVVLAGAESAASAHRVATRPRRRPSEERATVG